MVRGQPHPRRALGSAKPTRALLAFLCLLVATGATACGGRQDETSAAMQGVVSERATLYTVTIAGGRARLTSPRVGSFTFLSSPEPAPHGRAIAFTAQRCPTCPHLLQVVSPRHVQVVSRRALRVAWSPDGKRLFYVRVGPSGTTLYETSPGGRSSRPVIAELDSDGSASFDDPAISSDGRRIAFSREIEPIESRELFVLGVGADRARALTRVPLWSVEPDFSPDGRFIAFSCQRQNGSFAICVSRVDGTHRRLLTSGPGDRAPVFSPNGKLVVFSSERAGAGSAIRSLYVVGAGGGRVRRLTTGADDSEPAFSPDGRHVIFVRRQVRYVSAATASGAAPTGLGHPGTG